MEDSTCIDGFWVGHGATMTGDFRASARTAVTWGLPGQFAVGGFEIQHLPEPAAADTGRSPRAQANASHRQALRRQMRRVLQALYRPAFFRGHGRFDISGVFSSFDLRFTNWDPVFERAATRIRCYLIAKVTLPAVEVYGGHCPATRARAVAELDSLLRRLAAVFPKDVDILRLHLVDTRPPITDKDAHDQLFVTPESIGLRAAPIAYASEIRRSQVTEVLDAVSHQRFRQAPLVAGGLAVPRAWPDSEVDLLPTSAALSTAPVPLLLSLRFSPTEMTGLERAALAERSQQVEALSAHPAKEELLASLRRFQSGREWFHCSTQIAALPSSAAPETVASAVEELAVTYMGEYTASQRRTDTTRLLARLRTIEETEVRVAEFNLRFMQNLPWGALDSTSVHQRSWIEGEPPAALPEWGQPPYPSEELQDPDEFLQRDFNRDGRLVRLREMLSLEETASLFQLPAVPAGGQAGLVSRIKNPFEQLPAVCERETDIVTFGKVQHRFLREPLNFSMPLVERIMHVSGILDRVSIVAGSPGSGKTNFCLSFLRQIYREQSGPQHPFLVIDPTRGNEFRALRTWIPSDLLVFTVGDNRCAGFCFNPFIVPVNVSVQAHISRLMSCFKAAYNMWDPLPAIFEMALRLAYQVKRAKWWEAEPRNRGIKWVPSMDFARHRDEPFPDLDDVVEAMGDGNKDATCSDGSPTIMAQQRVMWGEGTENSATIVASTYLRLNNLRENYSHILGGAKAGRACVDLEKLLERPVVLELGMVGDSQALSLVMGFLIVSLAGIIERPVTEAHPKRRRLLVIEEAHRLLSGEGGGGNKEGGNSKAQAAEDINNMLAEVRKYGLGVMLLDQRPASLVGGVIDNAYVVAMHRLNEEKSFTQFSKVLNLSADQQRFARTELRPGELIALDRRSGLPVLMRSEDLDTSGNKVTDEELRDEMVSRIAEVMFPTAGGDQGKVQRPTRSTPLLDALSAYEDGVLAEGIKTARVAADSFYRTSRSAGGFDTFMRAVLKLRQKLDDEKLRAVTNGLSAAQQQDSLAAELLAREPDASTVLATFLAEWRENE